MRAVMVRKTGGPEVLIAEDVPDPEPGSGEVLVENAAAGLNFIDTYQRTGLYARDLPFIPGLEGAGMVTAVGEGVDDFAVGDRVAYSSGSGAYAEQSSIAASVLVTVPEAITLDQAAAVMLQGLTAHYLVRETYPIEEGSVCLIHAGAGGVGLVLTQMAKRLGATVFTTVGTEEKAELSRAAGSDHVVLYNDEDFGDAIERVAGDRPLDVVYDGVGKATLHRGFELLRPRGVMVAFGNASGAAEPVDPLTLAANGSLYLTRPTLFTHIATKEKLDERAAELFGWIADGLDVRIGARFPLEQAADAHQALEGRQTTGKVLIDVR